MAPTTGPYKYWLLGKTVQKLRQQLTLTCSGLQLAKQLDSCEDIAPVIVMEIADSVFWHLAFTHLEERWRAN